MMMDEDDAKRVVHWMNEKADLIGARMSQERLMENARTAIQVLRARGWQRPYETVENVTRFEVIDHRPKAEGRVFAARPCSVSLAYQDDGRTLKVFVT